MANSDPFLIPAAPRRRHVHLERLGPREQLRAGRLPRRLVQLVLGLWLYGLSMAMMIRAGLGLDPWDVLHAGLADRLGISFGAVVTVVGALVLLAWVPLRQMPGLGTIANVAIIGIATDVGLAVLPVPDDRAVQVLALTAGVLLNGVAGATYIGAQLGPGPRDGLMTGLAARTGLSLRVVRTAIEVAVLACGYLLGGPVGLGTVLYALAIGPLVQALLPWLLVPVEAGERRAAAAPAAAPSRGACPGDPARPHHASRDLRSSWTCAVSARARSGKVMCGPPRSAPSHRLDPSLLFPPRVPLRKAFACRSDAARASERHTIEGRPMCTEETAWLSCRSDAPLTSWRHVRPFLGGRRNGGMRGSTGCGGGGTRGGAGGTVGGAVAEACCCRGIQLW